MRGSEKDVFKITSQLEGGSLVLRVSGELDLAAAREFGAEIERAIQSDAERIVIELEDLVFLDSRGISALLKADADSRQDGDRLHFQGAHGQVERVLKITGVGKLLA